MLPLRKCGLLARNALSFASCTSNYGSMCISEAGKPFHGMWAVHVRNNTLAFERGIFPSRLVSGNVRSIRSLSVSNIKYADSSEDRKANEDIEEESADHEKIPLHKYFFKNAASLSGNPEGQDESFNEALKEGKFLLRMLVTEQMAKALLTDVSKSLGEKFKLSLEVEVEDVPETVVTLKCDQTDLTACVEEICNKFAEFGSPSDKPGEKSAEIRLLVHNRYASRLVGKSHKERKERSQNLGIQLNELRVYADVLPYSTERIVHITTSPSKIVGAVIKITDAIRTQPLDCLQLLYVPDSISGPLPKKAGGLCNGDEDAMAYDEMPKTKVTVPKNLMEALEENGAFRTVRYKCATISIKIKNPKSKDYRIMTVHGYPVQHDYAFWLLREQIMQLDGGPQYLESGIFNKKEN
ncbi:heterogeneous nuclear ribonucleoprotein K [Ditylenchus destructor]|uniref:Heterogeneous nuclear ribonucleoprotein K n=1 Tax=Ditylenchus destructor TaxID=166010 RepID=A0AAD4NDF9_9BILA|nr:heterogeneous nuclear ribonucleoprotein K [Ditylenchus destructor]